MKKRVLCAALASMMALSMTACSSGSTATTAAETKASEAETTTEAASSEAEETTAAAAGTEGGTLIVGFDQDFPPMGFLGDNNEYTGFDLELAQEVAKRLGLEYQAQPIAWDAKDMELESGNIDCIWNGFTMNGREDQYTWSDPYFDNKQVIVVKNGSGIDSLSDLKGKNVETQKDSSALAALQGDQKALADTFGNLVEVADYNTAFMDLESGACDAIAVDIGVAHYQINSKDNGGDFVILNDNISSEQYAIGFKNGNTELRDQVQSTLDEMFKDGTIDKIADKYSDYDIKDSLIRK